MSEEHKSTTKKHLKAVKNKLCGFCKTAKNPSFFLPVGIAVIVVGVVVWLFLSGWLVAATVNGSPISRHAVRNQLEQIQGQAVLSGLITEKIIDQQIKSQKITVTPAEVEAEIAELTENLTSQGLDLETALLSEGLTMNKLEKQIYRQLALEKMFAEEVSVTDEEVTDFLAEVDFARTEETDEEWQEVLDSVKDQITQEKLFNAFQTENSKWQSEANIKYLADVLK